MYFEAWSEITLDSMSKRLCNSYTTACPPEHVLPSRESARMPAEVYMLTEAKHDLVLLGQLLLLRPARSWAKPTKVYRFSQRNMIAPASPPICSPDNSDPSRRRDPGRTPADVSVCLLGQLLLLRPARSWAKANQSLPIFPAKHDRARQPAHLLTRQL